MKNILSHIVVLGISALIFSGCYTQVKTIEIAERPTSYNNYDDYSLGYYDGFDSALLQFRNYERSKWSGSIGYHYSPHRHFHSGFHSSFFYGYHHSPFYSHYDYLYHPYYAGFGFGFHYYSYPWLYHRPNQWYGHYGRPIIIYNNYYAQAQPRPEMVRGSGVNRGSGAISANSGDPSRVEDRRPSTRVGVTPVGSTTGISRGTNSSPTIYRNPPTRRGSSGTVTRPPNRGSSGSSGNRPQTRQGNDNRGSSSANRPSSRNNSGSSGTQTRNRNDNNSNSSGSRPRSRNDQAMHIPADFNLNNMNYSIAYTSIHRVA